MDTNNPFPQLATKGRVVPPGVPNDDIVCHNYFYNNTVRHYLT